MLVNTLMDRNLCEGYYLLFNSAKILYSWLMFTEKIAIIMCGSFRGCYIKLVSGSPTNLGMFK